MRKKTLLKLLLFVISITTLQAQTITWDGSATGVTPTTVTFSGEAAKLRFVFIATGSAINNANIEITLPTGYTASAVANGATMAGDVTYTTSGINTGTITLAIDGGTLATGKSVDIVLDVKANCSAIANGSANVKVKSGATTLDTRTVAIVGAYPALRIQTATPNQSHATIGHVFNYDLELDVTNGLKANSFKLTLGKDASTTISNFKLDGSPVTPSASTTTSVEFTFNNINLEAVVKHFTFEASNSYAGTKNISSSLQYLSASGGSNCGSPIAGPIFTFGAPAVPGTPSIDIVAGKTGWVAESSLTGSHISSISQVPMDGTTIAYFRVTYKNTGSASTKQIRQTLQCYRSGIYTYANIVEDPSKIKYSIDGGTTIQTATAANISFSDRNNLDNGYRKLKTAYSNKPRTAQITINDPLPAGNELVIYWPLHQGDIYDNTGYTPTAFAINYPWASIQWNFYNISAIDQNGNSVAVPQNTYGAGSISNPLFASTPPSLSFRQTGSNSQKTSTIYTEFGTANLALNQTTDLYIQLPTWLELDGTPATAITTTGAIAVGYPKEEVVGSNRYVLRHTGGGRHNVTLKYKVKAGACSGVNQTGEIYYWLNYNLGGSTSTRPVLKEIGQIRQSVSLLCETDGIVMDSFEPYRITRGLKDSDQNRVPDANTSALDNEILHDTYLTNDQGKMIITGTVQGSFGHLYTLISSSSLNLALQLIRDATVSVNGGAAQTATLTKVDDKKYYIHFPGTFSAGNTVKVEILFTAITALNTTVKAELYMAASVLANPFSPGTARRGKDELFIPLKIYSPNFATDRGNYSFSNTTPVANFQLPYMDSYHGNGFTYPFLDKEYRVVGKPKVYEVTVPIGYVIPTGSSFNMIFNSGYATTVDAHTATNPTKTLSSPTSVVTNSNGSTTYRFDLTGFYATAYDGDGTYAGLPTNKWIYPDERYYYDFNTTIQATRAALSSGNITCKLTYTTYADNHATETSSSRSFNVAFTGDKATLMPSTNSLTAYNKKLTLPVLSVSNASPSANNMWLYIKEGDGSFTISDVNAKESGGGNFAGVGNGKWISLGSFAANTTKNYELSFAVSNVPCSGSKNVEIYLFSNFGTAWTPGLLAPPILPNYDNLGDTKTLLFETSTAAINGSMAVNDSVIKFQVPYTLTAILNASGGQGDVYNGQMVITVPKGQKYVANSAKYTYGGTEVAVPAAVEAAIAAALGGGLGTDRNYTFKVSDYITGDNLSGGASGAPSNKQSITLKMNFTSECETDLLGTSFTGSIAGKNVCGNNATGNGNQIAEVKMQYTSSILFTVNPILLQGINAFNEIHKKDTLQIEFEKTFGTGNLTANDYIEVVLHENINIQSGGGVAVNSTHAALDGVPISISSNTTASGKRSLKLELPFAELNSLGSGGHGRAFSYKIPLEYTVADTVSPLNKIIVNVMNEVKLDATCTPQMFPVGTDQLGMGLVVGNQNPDTVYLGDPLPLHIASTGFTGKWYDSPTGGNLISTANPYVFTPTDTALIGDTTFYFSAEFGSDNFGRLPYHVKVYIHPSFIKDLDTLGIVCTDTMTLSVEAFGMDLSYQWYHNMSPITGATDTFYLADKEGKYYVIATDSVGESISSDTMSVYFNVVPKFTKNLPLKVTDCFGFGHTLSVETTGHHLMYQWYRNGVKIPGANTPSYYALSNDSSAYFRVSVKTVCGDSIMSQQCYLSFCDEDESVNISRPVHLIAPSTVITNPGTGMHMVGGHSDFEFTINAKEGYGMNYLNVTTDDPIWTDQGGIIIDRISEFEAKVTIQMISRPLTVTVGGVSPVSNENFVDYSSQAWGYKGKLYIRVDKPQTVQVYTVMGHLFRSLDVNEGENSFELADGIYFITFEDSYSVKVFIGR